MNYSIFTFDSPTNHQVHQELVAKLMENGFTESLLEPELVFTIGGDGTVLRAIHHYLEAGLIEKVKFIGIHTGHLGFYTDWLPEEVDEMVTFLKNNALQTHRYPLLVARLCAGCRSRYRYALNEFTIVNPKRTQQIDVKIDNMYLESFRGTGICVSTPTGSTAYNKALGGALIYPSLPAFQLTEVASINNNAYRTIGSPLIIPKEQVLVLGSENWEGMTLTQDHLELDISSLSSIHVKLSDKTVNFVKRDESLFWNRVKTHFL